MAGLDSVALEDLRHIRGAIDDDRDDILEIKLRIKNLKTLSANRSNRLDRMDLRLAPIELRLDLAEA
jgi:hypothetical protein